MTWLLYLLMILGIPILYCILLYRLQIKIPKGRSIVLVFMGILIFHTILSLPMYLIFVPVITDNSYELFQTCLLLLTQFYIYGIIIIGLYVAYFIFIKKEKKLIISIIIITIIFTVLLCFLSRLLFKERKKPDDLYLEMKEININNSLIGLSKEEVVKQLGEPMSKYKYKNKESYTYLAGHIYVGIIWGNHNISTKNTLYLLSVEFDETDKVTSTSMSEST